MKDGVWFLGFVFLGFGFGQTLMFNTPTYKNGKVATNLIRECEKTLPRNEKCYINAEPETTPHKD